MAKKYRTGLGIGGLAALAVVTALATSSLMKYKVHAQGPDSVKEVPCIEGGEQCVPLIAGQHIEAGTVCVAVDGDDLLVTYNTFGDWYLRQLHLWVGTSLAGVPSNPRGIPVPGHFPYKAGPFVPLKQSHTFRIPLSTLGFECPSAPKEFVVAAHAELVRLDHRGKVVQQETGWGGDKPGPGPRWWYYFKFTLKCCPDDDNGPKAGCETAFAYLDGSSVCFSEFGFRRWGWTTPLEPGDSETFALYAGAGQCDIDRGTHVGWVEVTYVGGKVTVDYELFEDYTLTEVHVYAGCEPTPRLPNGRTTVAPGQYTVVVDNLDHETGWTDVIDGLNCNPVWVIAHAVVCGPGLDD